MELNGQEQALRVLDDPQYGRNLRRQLATALRALDAFDQRWLACDYAEHVVRIWEEVVPTDVSARQAIIRVREFLRGRCAIEAVAAVRSDHFAARHASSEANDARTKAARSASWATVLAICACCQRELEALGVVIRHRTVPHAADVAAEAAYAVALYTGGEDWDAAERALREAAHQAGRAASDREVEWQLAHLRAYLTVPK